MITNIKSKTISIINKAKRIEVLCYKKIVRIKIILTHTKKEKRLERA